MDLILYNPYRNDNRVNEYLNNLGINNIRILPRLRSCWEFRLWREAVMYNDVDVDDDDANIWCNSCDEDVTLVTVADRWFP